MTYRDKLKSPRWQKKRLEVFSRANWKCQKCSNAERQLHVHHLTYRRIEPWEYEDAEFEVLCERCHLKAHDFLKGEGRFDPKEIYTRKQIQKVVGGLETGFLPMVNGHVVCGCFRERLNPDAPDIILPGDKEKITEPSEIFCRQRFPIPIFIAQKDGWKYVGDYRVESWTENKKEIALHANRAKQKTNRIIPISRILFLEKVHAAKI
jgi:hypothetical protein